MTGRRITVLVAGLSLAFSGQALTVSVASADGTATQISAGGYNGCAVTPTARLKCWGDNNNGQLGIGDDTATDQRVPVIVPHLRHVKQVSVGGYHTCAVLRGGALKCWGWNEYGQVGDGTQFQRNTPVPVVGLSAGVVAVSAGEYHTCALLETGKVMCWGHNPHGEIGTGVSGGQYETPQVVVGIGHVTQVSAGYRHTCATTRGKAQCWGYGFEGELGNGSNADSAVPVQVAGLTSGVKQVMAGYYTGCAILTGGKLKCWGGNYYGEVGTGSAGNTYYTPTQVRGMTSGVTSVDPNYYFTCAIQSGEVKCWGDNQYWQVGTTSGDAYVIPRTVQGLGGKAVAIDIGWYHSCALLVSGVEKCWGWNGEGELGINSPKYQIAAPQTVLL